MFAIVETGGKQYKVSPQDVIKIEKIAAEPGSRLNLEQVLLIGDGEKLKVGTPLVKGAKVVAHVLEQTRNDTILVFKKKRRHNYRRKNGHRQHVTVVRIEEIVA